LAPAKLYWYDGAPSHERAEVAAWVAMNDCSDIEVIGIDRTVVAAFGAKSRLHGWGTTEMRGDHDSVTRALAEVVARLRKMEMRA
jgi:hypothetical protein